MTPNRVITKIDKISDAIIHVMSVSTRHLVLVSPYIQLEFSKSKKWSEFTKAIESAIDRGVDVTFIARERDAHNQKDAMKLLKPYRDLGCNVYCVERLHAKIYCCDTIAIVTSMNLTLSSTIKNLEIAVVIHSTGELESIRNYIDEMKEHFTRRSINGARVYSRVKVPSGLKETWFKVKSKGTKYYHVKLEGKYPAMIEFSEVKSNVDIVPKKSYSCKANIVWRKVRDKNKAFVNYVTNVKERVQEF